MIALTTGPTPSVWMTWKTPSSKGVVEEDGAADADATAEVLEVVPRYRGRGIAVEEDEVDP